MKKFEQYLKQVKENINSKQCNNKIDQSELDMLKKMFSRSQNNKVLAKKIKELETKLSTELTTEPKKELSKKLKKTLKKAGLSHGEEYDEYNKTNEGSSLDQTYSDAEDLAAILVDTFKEIESLYPQMEAEIMNIVMSNPGHGYKQKIDEISNKFNIDRKLVEEAFEDFGCDINESIEQTSKKTIYNTIHGDKVVFDELITDDYIDIASLSYKKCPTPVPLPMYYIELFSDNKSLGLTTLWYNGEMNNQEYIVLNNKDIYLEDIKEKKQIQNESSSEYVKNQLHGFNGGSLVNFTDYKVFMKSINIENKARNGVLVEDKNIINELNNRPATRYVSQTRTLNEVIGYWYTALNKGEVYVSNFNAHPYVNESEETLGGLVPVQSGEVIKLQKPAPETFTNIVINNDSVAIGDCKICGATGVVVDDHICKTILDTNDQVPSEFNMTESRFKNIRAKGLNETKMITKIEWFKNIILEKNDHFNYLGIDYNDWETGNLSIDDVVNIGISPSYHSTCTITNIDYKSKTYSIKTDDNTNYVVDFDLDKFHANQIKNNLPNIWAFYSIKRKKILEKNDNKPTNA